MNVRICSICEREYSTVIVSKVFVCGYCKKATKRGAIKELKYLISCVHDDCDECKKTKNFFKERIKEIKKEGVEK